MPDGGIKGVDKSAQRTAPDTIAMFKSLIFAWILMSACVVVHVVGLTSLLGWLTRRTERLEGRYWFAVWMLVCASAWTVLSHVIQIGIWASFYSWQSAMPDFSSAFYFSAVTYTTTGYGDLVLPPSWRQFAGIEALTGILMCGLSTGFFFAILSHIVRTRFEATPSETSENAGKAGK